MGGRPARRPRPDVRQDQAKDLNSISRRIQQIVNQNDLPTKALVVHQFRAGSIRDRADVKQRHGVNVTLYFDGIGSPAAKKAGYKRLTRSPRSSTASRSSTRSTPGS